MVAGTWLNDKGDKEIRRYRKDKGMRRLRREDTETPDKTFALATGFIISITY
jgi:hypothetical protein